MPASTGSSCPVMPGRCEEEDRIGDLLDGRDPAQRGALAGCPQRLLDVRPGSCSRRASGRAGLGGDRAGRDRVDADAAATEVERGGADDAERGVLAGGVGGQVRIAAPGVERRDDDDRAAGDTCACLSVATTPRALTPTPGRTPRGRARRRRPARDDPGGGDDDVEPPSASARDRRLVAHVDALGRPDRRLGEVEHQPGAPAREAPRRPRRSRSRRRSRARSSGVLPHALGSRSARRRSPRRPRRVPRGAARRSRCGRPSRRAAARRGRRSRAAPGRACPRPAARASRRGASPRSAPGSGRRPAAGSAPGAGRQSMPPGRS